jgi:hypothetical protein
MVAGNFGPSSLSTTSVCAYGMTDNMRGELC